MLINIKTSEANKTVVTELTRKFFPQGGPENFVARVALSYSLSKGIRFESLEMAKDSRGKEYKEDILFGGYRDLYVALVCQHYNIHHTDRDIPKYLKMHIDDGLERLFKIFAENRQYSGFDFLMEHIERGTDVLEEVNILGSVRNSSLRLQKGVFDGPLKLHVGTRLDNGEPVYVTLNDKSVRNNAHTAVAGSSGTGKTQFALDLLRQFSEISGGTINFMYLDFKGLKQDDVVQMRPFFERTNTTFINAPQQPFPLNPLAFINLINEKERLMGISKFVDIVTTYAPRLGAAQAQMLKDATKDAFAFAKSGTYPSLRDIAERLFLVTGQKPDTLTQIIQSLSEYELFDSQPIPNHNFLNQNYYFSLSGDLDKTVRFTATFLAINYVYNTFMNMENAPLNGDYQALRYVLLIDEAHVLFKDKKSHGLLESMLREIRSKGVVVMLVSQGIEEFNQPSFDFSSECENAFLLNIKDKNLKTMQRFLGLSEREGTVLARSMERIEKGQAVSNLKEFSRGELFEVGQFWKNV
jgi:DNA sulfur modification protein DndE